MEGQASPPVHGLLGPFALSQTLDEVMSRSDSNVTDPHGPPAAAWGVSVPYCRPFCLAWKDLTVSVNGGQFVVLDGVIGHAKSGRLLAIMGPSGCGKTTLLQTLADSVRLIPMTRGHLKNAVQSGQIIVNGQEENLTFGKKTGLRYGEGLGREVMGDGSLGGNECLGEERAQWAQNGWNVLEARWSEEECELGAVGIYGLGSRGDGGRGEINQRKRERKRGSTLMGEINLWDCWSVLKNYVVPKLEVVIDKEKSILHAELMENIEEVILDPAKAKVRLKAENVDICYPPVFQSGGTLDLKPNAVSNDEPLYYDVWQ
ncbi:unnamed protein product [Calypogeia fissa]